MAKKVSRKKKAAKGKPASISKKRGRTFVSIGPEPKNICGFKSRMWNIVRDGSTIFLRWGKAAIHQNFIAPVWLHEKNKRFASELESKTEHDTLINGKIKKGYKELTRGYSLKPRSEKDRETPSPPRRRRTRDKARKTPEIFVSYAHKNMPIVKKIVGELEQSGFKVWFDQADLRPDGQPFPDSIVRAIRQSKAVVVVLTSQANESDWVLSEVVTAKDLGKRLFPIRIQNVNPKGGIEALIGDHLWIDAYGKKRNPGIQQLITALKGTIRK